MVFREYQNFIASFTKYTFYDTFMVFRISHFIFLSGLYSLQGLMVFFKNQLVNPSWIKSFKDVLISIE